MNLPKIETLPKLLVTPERYGKVVLAEVVELFPDLPEHKIVFGRFPESPEDIGA